MNNTLLFTYSTDIMVRLLTEICKTFLLQKSKNVQPHYSQNSHENATPSSGTSPLASYKEVLPGLLSKQSECSSLPKWF